VAIVVSLGEYAACGDLLDFNPAAGAVVAIAAVTLDERSANPQAVVSLAVSLEKMT
jgi:hypothetical protein